MLYGKLVRDRIPEIIESNGQKAVTKVLDEASYLQELRRKLQEEVDEYLGAQTRESQAEELADILEVIRALGADAGFSPEKIEKLRAKKSKQRGAFDKKIYLTEVTD